MSLQQLCIASGSLDSTSNNHFSAIAEGLSWASSEISQVLLMNTHMVQRHYSATRVMPHPFQFFLGRTKYSRTQT